MEQIIIEFTELINERKKLLATSKITAKKKATIEAQIVELEEEIKRVIEAQKAKDEASKK